MFRSLVHSYGWIHLGIGLFGNFCFVLGSLLFSGIFGSRHTLVVCFFIVGSVSMFVGSLGQLVKWRYEAAERKHSRSDSDTRA